MKKLLSIYKRNTSIGTKVYTLIFWWKYCLTVVIKPNTFGRKFSINIWGKKICQ